MYLHIYRGSVCAAPSPRRPAPCARLRLSRQACAACGGDGVSSNVGCFSCACAATSVDKRWNRFGAYAPPNPIRLQRMMHAEPSGRD
eukprot:3789917-Pleurochrysis_carterae.AAC.2